MRMSHFDGGESRRFYCRTHKNILLTNKYTKPKHFVYDDVTPMYCHICEQTCERVVIVEKWTIWNLFDSLKFKT